MLPLSFRVGIDLSKAFGLGAFFGYSSTKAKPSQLGEGEGSSYLTNKTKVFGLRAAFRKEFSDRVEGYGGSMLSYNHVDVKEFNNVTKTLVIRAADAPTPFNPNQKKGKIVYSAFMGANFKITPRVNLYGEIGYGISVANFGVCVRV